MYVINKNSISYGMDWKEVSVMGNTGHEEGMYEILAHWMLLLKILYIIIFLKAYANLKIIIVKEILFY